MLYIFRKHMPKQMASGQYDVIWETPPGLDQGVVFRQRVHRSAGAFRLESRIGPRGLLNLTQAALALGVSRPTTYHWIDQGKLKAVQTWGRQFIPLSEIKKCIFPAESLARAATENPSGVRRRRRRTRLRKPWQSRRRTRRRRGSR